MSSTHNPQTENNKKRNHHAWLLRLIAIILGMAVGVTILPSLWQLLNITTMKWLSSTFVCALIGGVIFYLLILCFEKRLLAIIRRVEISLKKKSVSTLIVDGIGWIFGLAIGSLFSLPLYRLKIPFVNNILPLFIMMLCGYLSYYLLKTRGDELSHLFSRDKAITSNYEVLERKAGDNFRRYKILDTSVIIDGRIYDIAKTGFIEGTILIPKFVLYELQYIADSADSLKRVRGRRGLDILNDLQKEEGIDVEMYEGDFEDIEEVDTKLIKLAKLLDGIVVTNDFNLNKVCEFQNVPVLNINALANAVKPVVIPGEKMTVTIVKTGTERAQGVAYLDDGTMIVVEDGRHHMNETVSVVVTSALQTAAGRMIFAKLSPQTKNLKEKIDDESSKRIERRL